jgi:hypothetical protein
MLGVALISDTQSAVVELVLVAALASLASATLNRQSTTHRGFLFSGCFLFAGRYLWWRATA